MPTKKRGLDRPISLSKVHDTKKKKKSKRKDDDNAIPTSIPTSTGNGLDSKSSLDDAEEDDLRQAKASDIIKQNEEDETGDEDEASSVDDANDFDSDSRTNVDETASTSSFHRHVGHILNDEDADELVKSKWKYKWEMPADEKLMSKWVGTGEPLPMEVSSDLVYGVKQKLYNHWLDIYKASSFAELNPQLRFVFSLYGESPSIGDPYFINQADRYKRGNTEMYLLILKFRATKLFLHRNRLQAGNSYRDIMHCNKKPFYFKRGEDSVIMDAYLMHTLNHVFKTRDLVSKNNAKLTREEEGKREELLINGSSFLDHGFTRPKVLFLLPLGSIALRVVKRLIQLIPASHKANVEHIDRFYEEFGAGDSEEDDEDSKTRKRAKPKDFQRLFGGNNNDHFVIGIKLTKRSIKLYNDFYSSDIIIASPLGLITKIGEVEVDKGKNVDYLSSIEVLIIDHADVIAMQNWSHLNTVVEHLNHTPSQQHGTDVMRIRQWYLDGHARFYRQTILLGSYLNPDMNALFNRSCMNYEGKIKLMSEYKGVLPDVLLQVRQVYERFDASSIVDVDEARLDYFCKKVFPKIKDSTEGGIMLFISSYFEYVRLRNFLSSQKASVCLFGDYAEPSDISRARGWFFKGERKIMLYTERAHFYHRYKIRGIKTLLIYSLPERKEFYPEIINMLEEANNMTCSVLFSRFDLLRLERIVGTTAAKRMVSSDKNIFVFC